MAIYGVSETAAKWQIANATSDPTKTFRVLPSIGSLASWPPDFENDLGREKSAKEKRPVARSGRFEELCGLAYDAKLISADTAGEFTCQKAAMFEEKAIRVHSPDSHVWQKSRSAPSGPVGPRDHGLRTTGNPDGAHTREARHAS